MSPAMAALPCCRPTPSFGCVDVVADPGDDGADGGPVGLDTRSSEVVVFSWNIPGLTVGADFRADELPPAVDESAYELESGDAEEAGGAGPSTSGPSRG